MNRLRAIIADRERQGRRFATATEYTPGEPGFRSLIEAAKAPRGAGFSLRLAVLSVVIDVFAAPVAFILLVKIRVLRIIRHRRAAGVSGRGRCKLSERAANGRSTKLHSAAAAQCPGRN
jgi:hypothetical protein